MYCSNEKMVAFIPDQDETVYNYAKPAPVIEPKPPRYHLE